MATPYLRVVDNPATAVVGEVWAPFTVEAHNADGSLNETADGIDCTLFVGSGPGDFASGNVATFILGVATFELVVYDTDGTVEWAAIALIDAAAVDSNFLEIEITPPEVLDVVGETVLRRVSGRQVIRQVPRQPRTVRREGRPESRIGVFTARGYSTSGLVGMRAQSLGPFELAPHRPTYILPYLGWGLAGRPLARGGPLELTADQSYAIALGRPLLYWTAIAGPPAPHVVRRARQAAPTLDLFRGRAVRRKGSPIVFVPTPRGVQRIRTARQVPPHPDQIRARSVRRGGVAPNLVPTPGAIQRIRVSRQVPPHPSQLQGRVIRRRGVSQNITIVTYNMAAIRIRVARTDQRSLLSRFASRRRDPTRLVVFPREVALVESLSARASAEVSLLAAIYARAAGELALVQDLDGFALEQYRVILRNVATGVEVDYGRSEVKGAAVPDGAYRVRIEVYGRYWRRLRYATEYPLTIVSGLIAEPYPEVRGLVVVRSGTDLIVSFVWEAQEGTSTPATFSVWTGLTAPVDVTGVPVASTPAAGVGGYSVPIASAPTILYVAVAANGPAKAGPASTVAVPPEEPTIASPDDQSARIPDGDWAP